MDTMDREVLVIVGAALLTIGVIFGSAAKADTGDDLIAQIDRDVATCKAIAKGPLPWKIDHLRYEGQIRCLIYFRGLGDSIEVAKAQGWMP